MKNSEFKRLTEEFVEAHDELGRFFDEFMGTNRPMTGADRKRGVELSSRRRELEDRWLAAARGPIEDD